MNAAADFVIIANPESDPGADEILTFKGVPSIHFRTNTASATARVAICVGNPGERPALVAPLSDMGAWCREVRDIEDGTRLRWIEDAGDSREHLILVVSPSKPGVATVDRVTYDYERKSGQSGVDVGTLAYTIRAT